MANRELFVLEIDGIPERFYKKQATAKGVLTQWSKYYDLENIRLVRYVPADDGKTA